MLALPVAAAAGPPAATTFNFTGAQQQYVVPAGVHLVNTVAVGGNGGQDPMAPGSNPPQGAALEEFLPVTPGEVLYVAVGANGTDGGPGVFGGGGAGASGQFYPSGTGGGATDIRTCSASAASCPGGGTSLGSRLVVAAGAGGDPGAGQNQRCGGYSGYGADAAYGQAGPTAPVSVPGGTILPGFAAGVGPGTATEAGGGGATAGGAGGTDPTCGPLPNGHFEGPGASGTAGVGPNGGAGGQATGTAGSGAGGGGGYFGGGGGAAGGNEQSCTAMPCASAGGEGGGAGSSFISTTYASGSWTFHNRTGYPAPIVSLTPAIEIDSPTSTVYTLGQPVTVSWSCASFSSINFGSCTAAQASGAQLDTSKLGTFTFTVSTTGGDSAGVTYTVANKPSPPSNRFSLKATSTSTLTVKLPGPGVLVIQQPKSKAASSKKKAPTLIARQVVHVNAAGAVKVRLKLTSSARKLLAKKGKLVIHVLITYTPTGGTSRGKTISVTIRRTGNKRTA